MVVNHHFIGAVVISRFFYLQQKQGTMDLSLPFAIVLGWVIGFILFFSLIYYIPRYINSQVSNRQKLLSWLINAAQLAQHGQKALAILPVAFCQACLPMKF